MRSAAGLFLVLATGAARAQTIVSLGFDDTTAGHALAGQILDQRGLKATFYVNSPRFGSSPTYMTLAQARTLAANGHEIAGHTLGHVDLVSVSAEERRRQICDDRARLVALGFTPVSFAYPFGSNNSSVQQTVRDCGYSNARVVGSLSCSGCPASEPIPPVNSYAIRTPASIRSNTTLAQMQQYVVNAENAGGGLVPIVLHFVCDNCSELSISPSTLGAFADWLAARASRGTFVRTMREALGAPAPPPPPPPPPPGGGTASSLWPTQGPGQFERSLESAGVTLGTSFRSDVSGQIRGIRYYKPDGGANGPKSGRLYSNTGALLGSLAFPSATTAAGWKEALFPTPIAIQADTLYVAAYFTNTGYSATRNYFTASRDNAPLHAPASAPGAANGLYLYGAAPAFPTNTTSATNYWADVLFSASGSTAPASNPTPSIAALIPASTAAGGPAFTLTVDGSSFVAGSVVRWNGADRPTSLASAGRLTASIPSGDVASQGTATVTVFNPAPGGGTSNGASFTIAARPAPPPSTGTATTLWTTQAPGPGEAYLDPQAVNLGVRFRSDVAGQISGVRFYKVSGNNGPHVGRLYTNAGALLASVNFAGETATGWQTATFSAPVAIAANTLYVASYHSPTGYATTRDYFLAARDNPPLHAPASAPGALNGLYLYGSSPAFPAQSSRATNYWVDVVFNSGTSAAALAALACPACPAPPGPITDLEQQRAFPNPWRGDRDAGKPLMFDRMPPGSEIQIYSISGRLLRTLSGAAGSASWDLNGEDGQRAATGFYLYRISAPGGAKKSGKLAIVR